jgi:hypothetical protein
MKHFKLTVLEFRALANFLNATHIPGLAVEIGQITEDEYFLALNSLQKHHLLTPGERKGTWHFDEDLLLLMTTVVSPEYIVLAQDISDHKSILFYMFQKSITEIVVTDEYVLIAGHTNTQQIAEQVIQFLADSKKSQIAIAKVTGNKLTDGRRLQVENKKFSKESIYIFIKKSIDKYKQNQD